MDPLSVAASVIAVVGAARQVTKGLAILKKAKGAPRALDDLLNDISRFELVLSAFQNASYESRREAPELTQVLEAAKEKLLEIHSLVEYSLKKPGESSKVDRWQWLRKGNEVGRLRKQLGDLRDDLTALISSGSFASLQQISITSQLSFHEQQRINQRLYGQWERQEAMLALLCAKIEQSSLTQNVLAPVPGRPCLEIEAAVAKSDARSPMAVLDRNDKGLHLQSDRATQPKSCRSFCCCSCHQVQQGYVSGYGVFEISGFHFLNFGNSCDVVSCKGPIRLSIKVGICLPKWFARRMLSLWFTSTPLHGPELLLRVPRMVSNDSPIIKALEEGNFASFKMLVADGQGSPYDVDQDGNSFLTIAYRHWNRKADTSRLTAHLIDLEIECAYYVTERDRVNLSAVSCFVWDIITYSPYESCLRFLCRVDWDDVFKELDFSALHRVIFGLDPRSLEIVLKAYPQEIDKPDRFGYNALYYACRFGREDHTRILLSHGAYAVGGGGRFTPLIAAIETESLPCVKMLLESHGKLDRLLDTDLELVDYLLPYLGCCGDVERMIQIDQLLIEHGLDLDIQDPWGSTILMRCCSPYGTYASHSALHAKYLRLFLGTGADTEIKDIEGRTALCRAITSSNARAFDELVLAEARIDPRMYDGSTVLHLAVQYASDISIVQALIEADTKGIELEAQHSNGYSAFDLMKQRVRRPWAFDRTNLYFWPFEYRDCTNADTPEEEVEILAAFEVLFRKLQDERNVPVQARYPSFQSLIDSPDVEESERDSEQDEMATMPGAWLE